MDDLGAEYECQVCGNIVIFREENIKMAENGQGSIKAMSQEKHEAIHQGKETETIVDLPADLQDVYNVLHLTEKQFEVLDNFLEKALIALANQAKYEKALQLMAEHSLCATAYGNNCDVCDCENPNIRNKCMSQYINDFKQQAGLEV